MQMVTEAVAPDDQTSLELSSVASACLFSLVVALGDTGKMLAALTTMLTAPAELSEIAVQVSELQSPTARVLLRGALYSPLVIKYPHRA